MLCQVLERVNLRDHVLENLVEDVVDARTSLALSRNVLHEAPLELLGVLLQELADEVKNDGPHAVLVDGEVLRVVSEQLALFLLDGQRDLLR